MSLAEVMAPYEAHHRNEVMIDTFGWRSAFLLLAGIIFCVVFPMTALFHRRSPEEVGQHPDGMTTGFNGNLSSQPEELTKKISSSNLPEQWSLKAALCAKAFWYLELTAFSNGFLTNITCIIFKLTNLFRGNVTDGYTWYFLSS